LLEIAPRNSNRIPGGTDFALDPFSLFVKTTCFY